MKSAFTILLLTAVLGGGMLLILSWPKNSSPQSTDKSFSIAQQIIEGMTVEQKIGQLIIGGFRGVTMSHELERLVSMYSLGGFNILKRNVQDAIQTQKLVTAIEETYSKSGLPPPFIAADQEGGTVTRFPFLKELAPQGQINDVEEAKAIAQRRALELKKLGVNMVFSPVLDYVSDPKAYLYPRAFHAAPDQISLLGSAMVEGYRAGGVIAVPKHFPGYGNSHLDPHKNRVLFSSNQAEFDKAVGIFKTVISTASPEAMMTSHVVVPFIDSSPATLSLKIITDFLRKELGYRGIIITDDLEMASVRYNRTIADVAVEALAAGNDMLIVTPTYENIPAVQGAIKNALQTGIISQEALNEKALKVVSLKLKYLKFDLEATMP